MEKRFPFVLAALFCLLALPVWAGPQQPVDVYAGPVNPLGYCQLTSLASSTQLSACPGGIPAGAHVADIIVESQAVRYRDDGTAPTSTVGMPLAISTDKVFTLNDLSALRFIEQAASAKLSISFY